MDAPWQPFEPMPLVGGGRTGSGLAAADAVGARGLKAGAKSGCLERLGFDKHRLHVQVLAWLMCFVASPMMRPERVRRLGVT